MPRGPIEYRHYWGGDSEREAALDNAYRPISHQFRAECNCQTCQQLIEDHDQLKDKINLMRGY